MICPSCKKEMLEMKIPFVKRIEGVNHVCENKSCLFFGFRRLEIMDENLKC